MRAQRASISLAALLIAVAVTGTLVTPALRARAQDRAGRARRSELMRQKLDLSQKVLEALTVDEDFDAIAGYAKKLEVLSEAAALADASTTDAKQYAAFLSNFRRAARDLGRQSRAKDLEGATFAYVHLATSCVECHKFVRGERHRAGE